MKRLTWKAWVALALVFSLMAGCSNASSYVSDHYPLVDIQGKGQDSSKVYLVEDQDVPTTAGKLAEEEKPREISKESKDEMFLAYSDKIIQVQQDPANAANSLVEISTLSYAQNHYDSSFLQGYLTASLLQSLFGGSGGGWISNGGNTYKGYSSLPDSKTKTSTFEESLKGKDTPKTKTGTGLFSSKNKSDKSSTELSDTPKSSGTSGTWNTKSYSRKSDGSTPVFKSKVPTTKKSFGSFSTKRRR
ncbi:DUF4247 domain-containing protein [Gorillibacterium timonense]|uniref:DUF4247 domain-containing protein n=1 Tax=Gorillibacterium timonense TaxID=1689269 RepID=UPI00071D8F86|nr:DUF4247 domain-containing protein [Gorillibacterium timonense]